MHKGAEESLVKFVTVEEVEQNCLEMFDLIEEKGFTYVVTKVGKPYVMMIPAPDEPDTPRDTA